MNAPQTQQPANIEPVNPFALQNRNASAPPGERSSMDAMISRQAQEVQAAMVIAKKFPRDEVRAFDKIMVACQRRSLAEAAIYSFPKGGGNVSGPSIRLAEAVAQAWGNLDFGIIELEQKDGSSEVMSYAWDLETNTRQTKIFTVNHYIQLRGGQIKKLSDPRDIYELVANQGARRLRACILGVIPGDVIEAAVNRCDDTLVKADSDVPLIDRIRKMLTPFDELGVTAAMIEKRFNKKLDKLNENEVSMLRKIYASIRDGMTKIEDQFAMAAETPTDLKQPANTTAEKKPAKKPVEKPAPVATPPATTQAANSDQGEDNVPMDYPSEPAEPAKPTKPALPPREALAAMLTASGFNDAFLVETCLRRFKGPPVKSSKEFTDEYVDLIIQEWTLVTGYMRTDRAIS